MTWWGPERGGVPLKDNALEMMPAAKAQSKSNPVIMVIVVIVIAVILFIVAAGVYLFFLKPADSTLEFGSAIANIFGTETKAVAAKDLAECDKMRDDSSDKTKNVHYDISVVDMCYAQVATAKKDSSICEKITTAGWKDTCYLQVATAKADQSLCEKIIYSDSSAKVRDTCYFSVVMNTKDKSLCEKIRDSQIKQGCDSVK